VNDVENIAYIHQMKTTRNYVITGSTKFLEPNWWSGKHGAFLKTQNSDTLISVLGRFHPFYRPRKPLGRIEATLFSNLGTRRG
jgi:hypothetical protein